MALVVMIVFVTIFAAWARFAARQVRTTAGQTAIDRTYLVAESGISHTLSLLNGGSKTPADLTGWGTEVGVVTDDGEEAVGTYVVSYTSTASGLEAASLGQHTAAPGVCQRVVAVIESLTASSGARQYYVSEQRRQRAECAGTAAGALIGLRPAFTFEGDPGGPDVRAVFVITVQNPPPVPIYVTFSTADGTAVGSGGARDYVPVSERVVIPPGRSIFTVTVDVIEDLLDEGLYEFFYGQLSDSNAQIDPRDQREPGYIWDDD